MVSWILSTLLVSAVAGQAECTIVYFGAANCQPCQQMAPTLARLQQEGWDIRNVDASLQPELAQRYQIRNLPTLVIVSHEKEVDRIVGAVSYDQLNGRFMRAAARNQSSSTLVQAAPRNTGGANGPVVRGQSPSSSGFPMLAASAVAPIVAAASHIAPATNAAAIPSSYPSMQPSPTANREALGTQPTLSNQPSPVQQFPLSHQSALSVEQAIARAAAATVRLKVEEANTTAYGTGTIIDVHGSEGLILTCGHLFRDMKPGSQLSVDLFAGTPQEVNIVAQLLDFKAEAEDIGVVSFQLPVAIEPVEILPRGETLEPGQPAFSFGCDHGQDPTRRDTQIRHIDRYVGAANVEIVGAPAVGRSGGGLFDLEGRLIGVCNAADATDDEGIYAAGEVMYAQIERLGMSHLFESKSAPPTQLASLRSSNTPPASSAVAMTVPTQTANAGMQQAISGHSTQEIICIMRDASGQNRVVTIPGPSPELMQAIEQHSPSAPR